MELPVKTPNSGDLKTQYRIKIKNLSYKLRPKYTRLPRVTAWWESPQYQTNSYILRNVNCEAKPGEITAIAGPSGAGKTTLLDILAGMILPRRLSAGHVLVNDEPMRAAHFRRVSGYVTQDEALFPLLTVEETLTYSARLRHKGGEGVHKAAGDRVRELLKELGLEHVAKLTIGNESMRGISGGEKRRVSIGVELVHDPDVLLLDEPSSGLDSASALHVVLLLKFMARNQGKTIVLTIHQPGFRILELFDQLVLLSNGTVLHHGPLQVLEEQLKFAGHCVPRHVNVLEFAMDVMETLLVDIEDDAEMSNTYQHISKISNLGNKEIASEIQKISDVGSLFPVRKETNSQIVTEQLYPNSRFNEVLILSQRFSRNIFRTKQLFAARIVQALLAGIFLGTIFKNATKTNLQTQIGFFAFSLAFLLSSTTEALPIYLEERRILMRETSRGAYRVSSYVVSNTLVFLPFLLTVALLYSTPVYWLVGLRRDIEGFLYFSLVVWMVVLMSNSFTACLSAMVPDFIMGTSLIAGVMGAFFLFSGYFISKDDIPRWWIFVHYLSLFKYPFECFMINEYGGVKGKGRCLEIVEGDQCLLNGNGFLIHQGLKESQKWSNLVVMLGFVSGYRLLCFVILWYRSYRTKC